MCHAVQVIFNSSVLWEQLGGQVGVGDIFVVRRKGITLQTEWTDPELSAYIDLAKHNGWHNCRYTEKIVTLPVWVENGPAWSLAHNRFVPNGTLSKVFTFL